MIIQLLNDNISQTDRSQALEPVPPVSLSWWCDSVKEPPGQNLDHDMPAMTSWPMIAVCYDLSISYLHIFTFDHIDHSYYIYILYIVYVYHSMIRSSCWILSWYSDDILKLRGSRPGRRRGRRPAPWRCRRVGANAPAAPAAQQTRSADQLIGEGPGQESPGITRNHWTMTKMFSKCCQMFSKETGMARMARIEIKFNSELSKSKCHFTCSVTIWRSHVIPCISRVLLSSPDARHR